MSYQLYQVLVWGVRVLVLRPRAPEKHYGRSWNCRGQGRVSVSCLQSLPTLIFHGRFRFSLARFAGSGCVSGQQFRGGMHLTHLLVKWNKVDQNGSYLMWLSLLWSHVFLVKSLGAKSPSQPVTRHVHPGLPKTIIDFNGYSHIPIINMHQAHIDPIIPARNKRTDGKNTSIHMFVACQAGLKYQVIPSVASMKPPNQTTIPTFRGPKLGGEPPH